MRKFFESAFARGSLIGISLSLGNPFIAMAYCDPPEEGEAGAVVVVSVGTVQEVVEVIQQIGSNTTITITGEPSVSDLADPADTMSFVYSSLTGGAYDDSACVLTLEASGESGFQIAGYSSVDGGQETGRADVIVLKQNTITDISQSLSSVDRSVTVSLITLEIDQSDGSQLFATGVATKFEPTTPGPAGGSSPNVLILNYSGPTLSSVTDGETYNTRGVSRTGSIDWSGPKPWESDGFDSQGACFVNYTNQLHTCADLAQATLENDLNNCLIGSLGIAAGCTTAAIAFPILFIPALICQGASVALFIKCASSARRKADLQVKSCFQTWKDNMRSKCGIIIAEV